jgi:3-isopropylmalate/(R)-2-methylmalate dehydratase small subunit
MIAAGDSVTVDVTTGAILDETTGRNFQSARVSPVVRQVIRAGGFVPYARRRLTSTTP